MRISHHPTGISAHGPDYIPVLIAMRHSPLENALAVICLVAAPVADRIPPNKKRAPSRMPARLLSCPFPLYLAGAGFFLRKRMSPITVMIRPTISRARGIHSPTMLSSPKFSAVSSMTLATFSGVCL